MCFKALCCKKKSRNFERSCSQNSEASQPLLPSSNTEGNIQLDEDFDCDINSMAGSAPINTREQNAVEDNGDQNFDTTISLTSFPM